MSSLLVNMHTDFRGQNEPGVTAGVSPPLYARAMCGIKGLQEMAYNHQAPATMETCDLCRDCFVSTGSYYISIAHKPQLLGFLQVLLRLSKMCAGTEKLTLHGRYM